jgi:hypothetical protein
MAMPSKMSAARRIDDRRKAEQPAALQNFPRGASQRGGTQVSGSLARQAGELSSDGGRGLDRAETQRALDERLSEHLDAIVNATLGLSHEQREIDRREAGAWRRFLWTLGGRRW